MLVDARGRETSSEVTPITERQQARIMAQNATIGEVQEIASAHAAAAMNHLANQLPAFIHSIIKSALQGYHQALQEQGIIPKDAPIGEWVEPVTSSTNPSVESMAREGAVDDGLAGSAPPEWT